MAGYLTRRALLIASTLLAVSFGAFVAFGLSLDPSGPLLMSPLGRRNPAYLLVVRLYDLHGPILVRYWHWLTGLLRHGFGTTVSTHVGGDPPRLLEPGRAIGPEMWHAATITAQLVAFSLVLVVVGSLAVGTLSARRRRSATDVSARLFAYIAASVPTFLVGELLRRTIVGDQTLVYHFTPQGRTPVVSGAGGAWFLLGAPTGGVLDWFRHMTLPAFALAIGLIGVYARYVRSSMLVALSQPYATVARAKGLPERQVVVRHALRNSLVPFVSALSLELGAVIGASLAADAVFNLGGLASVFLTALGASDPFELTALVVVTAAVVCVFVLVGDALIGVADPRTRVSSRRG